MNNSIDKTKLNQSSQAGNVSEDNPPEQTSSQPIAQESGEETSNPLLDITKKVAKDSQPPEEVKAEIEIDIVKNSEDKNSLYKINYELQRLLDLTRENIKSLEND